MKKTYQKLGVLDIFQVFLKAAFGVYPCPIRHELSNLWHLKIGLECFPEKFP